MLKKIIVSQVSCIKHELVIFKYIEYLYAKTRIKTKAEDKWSEGSLWCNSSRTGMKGTTQVPPLCPACFLHLNRSPLQLASVNLYWRWQTHQEQLVGGHAKHWLHLYGLPPSRTPAFLRMSPSPLGRQHTVPKAFTRPSVKMAGGLQLNTSLNSSNTPSLAQAN